MNQSMKEDRDFRSALFFFNPAFELLHECLTRG